MSILLDLDTFTIFLLASVVVLIILVIPYFLLFLFHKWLMKKGIKIVGLALILAFTIFLVYSIFTAFNPTDSFYLTEFKKVTLREAPKSTIIKNKDASYPDFQGEYCSASLLLVSKDEYSSLLNELIYDKRFSKNKPGEIVRSSEMDKVMGSYKNDQIIYAFTRKVIGHENHYLYIGFLEDKETIIVSLCFT